MTVVTRSIVGYKKEESDALLNFLYDHIAFGADFQARAQWKPRMAIFWDVGSRSSVPMSRPCVCPSTDDVKKTVW